MPSKSEAQKRFMQAAAHNPEFADKAGIDQKVAAEFSVADKDHPDRKLPEKVSKSTNESLLYKWYNSI